VRRDVLAFGQRASGASAVLPRAGVMWAWPSWDEVGAGEHPWKREAAAGLPEFTEPEPERPETIRNVDELEGEAGRRWRPLAPRGISGLTGLDRIALDPCETGAPRHCHSADEEIFVVLDGAGTLFLGDDEHPVRRGHVVGRPPATRVAHGFRAGREGLTYLAYGTREPNDICFYPTSGQISFRRVGLMTKVERLPYPDAF